MTSNSRPAINVAAQYRHQPKQVVVGDILEKPGALLKWYDLFGSDASIPSSVLAAARQTVAGNAVAVDGLGFVILHRCENDFYFLLISTWRQENELWETAWYKDGDSMRDFAPFRREPPHLPTFCVWELAIVGHEKDSWIRFLNSDRDSAAITRWRSDCYVGSA